MVLVLELVTVVVSGLFLGRNVAALAPYDERRAMFALVIAGLFGFQLGLDLVVVAAGGPAMAAGFLYERWRWSQ